MQSSDSGNDLNKNVRSQLHAACHGASDAMRDRARQLVCDAVREQRASLLDVLHALGDDLNNAEDDLLRAEAIKVLCACVDACASSLDATQAALVAGFLAVRLQDRAAVDGIALGLLTLFEQCAAHMAANDGAAMQSVLRVLFAEVRMVLLDRDTRHDYIRLLLMCTQTPELRRVTDAMGADFVHGAVQAMDGENDPRNLMRCFELARELVTVPDWQRFVDILFDLVSAYFPITFRMKPTDPKAITAQHLRVQLRLTMACSAEFAEFTLPFVMGKFDVAVGSEKIDCASTLLYLCHRYSAERVAPFAVRIFRTLHREVRRELAGMQLPLMPPPLLRKQWSDDELLNGCSDEDDDVGASVTHAVSKLCAVSLVCIRMLCSKLETEMPALRRLCTSAARSCLRQLGVADDACPSAHGASSASSDAGTASYTAALTYAPSCGAFCLLAMSLASHTQCCLVLRTVFAPLLELVKARETNNAHAATAIETLLLLLGAAQQSIDAGVMHPFMPYTQAFFDAVSACASQWVTASSVVANNDDGDEGEEDSVALAHRRALYVAATRAVAALLAASSVAIVKSDSGEDLSRHTNVPLLSDTLGALRILQSSLLAFVERHGRDVAQQLLGDGGASSGTATSSASPTLSPASAARGQRDSPVFSYASHARGQLESPVDDFVQLGANSVFEWTPRSDDDDPMEPFVDLLGERSAASVCARAIAHVAKSPVPAVGAAIHSLIVEVLVERVEYTLDECVAVHANDPHHHRDDRTDESDFSRVQSLCLLVSAIASYHSDATQRERAIDSLTALLHRALALGHFGGALFEPDTESASLGTHEAADSLTVKRARLAPLADRVLLAVLQAWELSLQHATLHARLSSVCLVLDLLLKRAVPADAMPLVPAQAHVVAMAVRQCLWRRCGRDELAMALRFVRDCLGVPFARASASHRQLCMMILPSCVVCVNNVARASGAMAAADGSELSRADMFKAFVDASLTPMDGGATNASRRVLHESSTLCMAQCAAALLNVDASMKSSERAAVIDVDSAADSLVGERCLGQALDASLGVDDRLRAVRSYAWLLTALIRSGHRSAQRCLVGDHGLVAAIGDARCDARVGRALAQCFGLFLSVLREPLASMLPVTRRLYQQKHFVLASTPLLDKVSLSSGGDADDASRARALLALGLMLPHLPRAVLIEHLPSMAPLLMHALSGARADAATKGIGAGDDSLRLAAIHSFGALLSENPVVIVDRLVQLVELLAALVVATKQNVAASSGAAAVSAAVRTAAARLLYDLCGALDYVDLYRVRPIAIGALKRALCDPKRAVRKISAAAHHRWHNLKFTR